MFDNFNWWLGFIATSTLKVLLGDSLHHGSLDRLLFLVAGALVRLRVTNIAKRFIPYENFMI